MLIHRDLNSELQQLTSEEVKSYPSSRNSIDCASGKASRLWIVECGDCLFVVDRNNVCDKDISDGKLSKNRATVKTWP